MAERIGEMLIRKKLITAEQLELALQDQANTGEFLGEILVRLGYTQEQNLLTVLAEQFGTRFVSLDQIRINPEVVRRIPYDLVLEHQFMPLESRGDLLLIAVSNPLNMWPLSALQHKFSFSEVKIVLAAKKDIQQTIQKYYAVPREMKNA